jgi:hypothetical protein
MGAKGKLLCSYPGPAIAVPAETVDDPLFRQELGSFLVQMNVDILDSTPITTKAHSTVKEVRDTAHPRYITQLLTEILRGMGEAADVVRIRKRIADDVLWKSALKPWRRSPMWLVIRVALQTSLYRDRGTHTEYKTFMAFMMAKMLHLALSQNFSSDLLFCMRAKMSRRLYKLGSGAPRFVSQFVHDVGNEVQTLLQHRWSKAQASQATSPFPEDLDIIGDTRLSLTNSKAYLSRILEGDLRGNTTNSFNPESVPRCLNTDDFHVFKNDDLWDAFESSSPYIALADFEVSVRDHFDLWIADNLHSSSAPSTTATCIDQYAKAALKAYASNPEDLSVMLLTIFHLWVGLDKVSVAQCPLLKDYTPEVPLELLEPLLLRRSSSFARVAAIVIYLRKRHLGANFGSVFDDDVHNRTFAVRYFDSSAEHQQLLRRIEADAKSQRLEKLEQLESLNEQHQDLTEQSRAILKHDRWFDRRSYEWRHDKRCHKCALIREADELDIKVHEWPLPEHSLKAKTVVFELRLPLVFDVWRSTTYKILCDICTTRQDHSEPAPSVVAEDYFGYQPYISDKPSRITLASTTKSFLDAHYRKVSIPSTESGVCVNNGLQFRYQMVV